MLTDLEMEPLHLLVDVQIDNNQALELDDNLIGKRW